MATGEGESVGREAAAGTSMSMRMVIYGIRKSFSSVRHVNAAQLQQWMEERGRGKEDLCCLVSGAY